MTMDVRTIPETPALVVSDAEDPLPSGATDARAEELRLLLDENRDLLARIVGGADRLADARAEAHSLRKESAQLRCALLVQETTLCVVRSERDALSLDVAALKLDLDRIRCASRDKTLALLAADRRKNATSVAVLHARLAEAGQKLPARLLAGKCRAW